MVNETATAANLPVLPGEDAWTEAEVDEVRTELESDLARHQQNIEQVESELREMLDDETATGDAADVGSANFERDHEMSVAANAKVMLQQTQLALEAIENGTYGRCEECGEPIGKGRLQVYPRATLCMKCKQRQERR